MSGELALVADATEWRVMHRDCARVLPTRNWWYAADIVNAVSGLRDDRCHWCQFKLSELPDPHLEIRTVA